MGTFKDIQRKIKENNSAILIEFQIGQRSPTLLAELMLIDSLIKVHFYNEMRIKHQLGYIVDSSISITGNTLGLIFVIQSNSKNSETLKKRIDGFLENFNSSLKNITDFEINEIRVSGNVEILEDDIIDFSGLSEYSSINAIFSPGIFCDSFMNY